MLHARRVQNGKAPLQAPPTDFNYLYANKGLEEVGRQIMTVVSPPPPPAVIEPLPDEKPKNSAKIRFKERRAAAGDDLGSPPIDEAFFRILGHDKENLYIYQKQMRMVVERKLDSGSEPGLIALAPLHWWEREFPADSGINKRMAQNWLVQTAFQRGYFDPGTLRGRGAWRDAGRTVYHFGNRLMVDGELMDVSAVDSTYVYEQSRRLRLPADEPMTAAEGKIIADTAKLFAWSRPASAILLAGWVALAPLCGALRWRPHLWITGGPGSGKSTILNEFVHYLMNGANIYAQGNSTEAGIRQKLRIDALPILFDESEQNNEREAMRVQAILALLRQASTESEAVTLKGTAEGNAQDYLIRSMACLSSIMVGMVHQADSERVSVLALKPKRREGIDGKAAADAWAQIKAGIDVLKAIPDLPARLMRRSLQLLPVTLENIEIFARVAAEKFGSQREGDQYGAMLAGAWSLIKTTRVTPQEARDMIDRYDWSDYLEGSEVEESSKALNALLEARIRMPHGAEMNVVELLEQSVEGAENERLEAHKTLMRHGMKAHADSAGARWMLIANSSTEPQRLVSHTPYTADLRGQLLRVPGARKETASLRFGAGTSRSIAIPWKVIFDAPSAWAWNVNDYVAFDSSD